MTSIIEDHFQRIVNGDNVEKGAIPWQIGLRLRQSGGASDKSICGGSIIRKVFEKRYFEKVRR